MTSDGFARLRAHKAASGRDKDFEKKLNQARHFPKTLIPRRERWVLTKEEMRSVAQLKQEG